MTWLVVVACVAWLALGVVGVQKGHERWTIRQARAAWNSVEARHNRIAQLEIELGITAPMYAAPEAVEQAWQARWDAAIGPGPPPVGMSRGWSDEERAAIEQTRARRKAVAETAAQKRKRQ